MAESIDSVVSNIVADANASLEQASITGAKLQESAKRQEQLSLDTKQKHEDAAQSMMVVAAQAAAAQHQAQQATIKVARAAGVDPSQAADIFVNLATRLKKTNDGLTAALDSIRGIKAKTFGEWLSDPQKAWEDTQKKNAGLKDIKNATFEATHLVNAADATTRVVADAKATYTATAESTTAATVAATTKLAAIESQLQANKAASDALKYNTDQLTYAMNTSKEQLAILHTKASALLMSQNADLALKKFQQEGEHFDINKSIQREAAKEREAAREEKRAAKGVDETTLEYINVGMEAFGKNKITPEEFASRKLMMTSGHDTELLLAYKSGRESKASGVGMIGNSPADALNTIEKASVNLADARTATVQLIRSAQAELAKSDPQYSGKDDVYKSAATNRRVAQVLAAQSANIIPHESNVRHVGDLQSYFKLEGISDLPLVRDVLAPLVQTGKKLENPAEVLQYVESAVHNKTLSASAAAQQLAQIYQKANMVHQQAVNFLGLGINLGTAAGEYTTQVKIGITSHLVNLADPSAVARALGSQMNVRRLSSSPTAIMSSDPFGILSNEKK